MIADIVHGHLSLTAEGAPRREHAERLGQPEELVDAVEWALRRKLIEYKFRDTEDMDTRSRLDAFYRRASESPIPDIPRHIGVLAHRAYYGDLARIPPKTRDKQRRIRLVARALESGAQTIKEIQAVTGVSHAQIIRFQHTIATEYGYTVPRVSQGKNRRNVQVLASTEMSLEQLAWLCCLTPKSARNYAQPTGNQKERPYLRLLQ